jgi:anti-anti-sigma factor
LPLVVLSGSLDQYSAEAVKEDLLPLLATAQSGVGPSTSVMLDLSAVDHLDASGLQILLSLRKQLSNKSLCLKGTSPEIENWIRLAGADHMFEFVSSGI